MVYNMIEVQRVHKSFNGQHVLRGLNLMIPRGQITVIIGRSGGGKSVLLKHLIGLLRPDSGKIIVDGTDITTLATRELTAFAKKFGMLFQNAALFDSFNVFDNVAFPLREHTTFSESKIRKMVLEKLSLVGLTDVEHKMPSELSGGMRKRVGLARAIVLQPEILMYDEPTTGLDPIMTDAIDKLILNTQRALGITSIVISHDIRSTFEIADQIAMLYEGEIIEFGPPEVFKQTRNPIIQRFLEGRSD